MKTPILPPINYPKILAKYSDEINVNSEIMKFYVDEIVPQVSCGQGDQKENLGSASTCDIECLQAISRRIHFVNLLLKQNIKVINHYISS